VPSGEPHLFDVFKTHIEALLHYTPQPYDGRIVLLRSSDERDAWHRDPTLGWGSLSTKPLDIYAVPGDHVTMLEPPHLKTLAAQLLICIERARLSSEGSE
jgi:thioesterase domain-containing protein